MYSAVSDAVRMRLETGAFRESDISGEVLHSDTMDQYRTFQMFERLLHCPSKLANQLLFQIPTQRQAMLIERYCLMCLVQFIIICSMQAYHVVIIFMTDLGEACCVMFLFVGIMSSTICLPERFWEKSFLKGPRRTWTILAQRQALL